MQVVCDRKKRVLYRSIRSRGAEHDSTSFKDCSFYKHLQDRWMYFYDRGFYLIGDSAYALRSFLITPYGNAMHGTPEDDFNFFHSSSRICIECTFGEVNMRWGILWRPLGFTMRNNVQIIDACLRLHNFIVDYREDNKEVTASISLERMVFKDDYDRFLSLNQPMNNYGVHNDNELNQLAGRPTTAESQSQQKGIDIRNDIASTVKENNYKRPKSNWYRDNNHIVDI